VGYSNASTHRDASTTSGWGIRPGGGEKPTCLRRPTTIAGAISLFLQGVAPALHIRRASGLARYCSYLCVIFSLHVFFFGFDCCIGFAGFSSVFFGCFLLFQHILFLLHIVHFSYMSEIFNTGKHFSNAWLSYYSNICYDVYFSYTFFIFGINKK
jgi:hypothetical protein